MDSPTIQLLMNYGYEILGYVIAILVFIWTRFIILRAWKVR